MISTRRGAHYGLLHCLLLLQLAACSSSPTSSFSPTSQSEKMNLRDDLAVNQDEQPQNPYLLERQPAPKQAQSAFALAVEAMQKKQWDQAEAGLVQLSVDYPRLSGPWLNLGIVYTATERREDAQRVFARAIEVNSNNLDAYNHLAALKRSDGDFVAAEELYRQALVIWPDHADSHLNLGVLYDIYMGRFDLAALHYAAYQALQDEPDRRIAGWLLDISRRPQMLARSETQ